MPATVFDFGVTEALSFLVAPLSTPCRVWGQFVTWPNSACPSGSVPYRYFAARTTGPRQS